MQFQKESPPSSSSLDAAVRLLADSDDNVHRICRARLLEWGDAARASLEGAVRSDDARLRARARMVLRAMDLDRWVGTMQGMLPARGRADRYAARPLLGRAMMLSGAGRTCSPDVRAVTRILEVAADRLRTRLPGRTAATCARLLAEVVHGELGFDGNHGSYYEADNVLLDRVVARRRGLPVALSVLYLVVGRMAGLSMAGVAMPDHFLVRIHGVRPALVDPFHGGRSVTKADCVRYLRRAGYGSASVEDLRDLGDEEVLGHLLRNLLRVQGRLGDREIRLALRRVLRHLETPV